MRALGLGDIRIDSALNEPLSAQIDIVGATRDELAGLTAKVAPKDVFMRYGAERPGFLSSATFKVGLDAHGRPVLNVRSAEPFSDPVVSFLVDLQWNNGELIREYSLLLDPAGFSDRRSPEAVYAATPTNTAPTKTSPTAESSSPPEARTAKAGTVTAHFAPTHASHVHAEESTSTAAGQRHRVGPRETLRAIVRNAGARSESQAQRMMIAVYRANPHAFDGNINWLRLGATIDLPTAEQVDAIDAVDARQEVRAQMKAWRMDGRPSMAHRNAAKPTPSPAQMNPPAAEPAMALQNRVQSLEAELDDMHKQLASEHATIEDLQHIATNKPAVPSAPEQTRPAAVSVEVMHAAPARAPVVAAAPAPTPQHAGMNTVMGSLAAAVALALAGFAYIRRRGLKPVVPTQPGAVSAPPDSRYADFEQRPNPAVVALPPATDQQLADTMPVEVLRSAPNEPRFAAPAAPKQPLQEVMIDPEALEEALERSYLDALAIDTLGIDTAAAKTHGFEGAEAHNIEDTATNELATLDTVALDATEIMAAEMTTSTHTAIIEEPRFEPGASAPAGVTAVDYDLLDLDSTAEHVQHVQMPSQLHDHVVVSERRMNIVDVLKTAIDRDPNRRDLRMKLLETYYGTASTNRRAFLDVVKQLSREDNKLTADDWKKIMTMGREIAADDIFFADTPKDDIANCA